MTLENFIESSLKLTSICLLDSLLKALIKRINQNDYYGIIKNHSDDELLSLTISNYDYNTQTVELSPIQFSMNAHYQNIQITDITHRMSMLNLSDSAIETLYNTKTNSTTIHSHVNPEYLVDFIENLTEFVYKYSHVVNFNTRQWIFRRIISFQIKPYQSVNTPYKLYGTKQQLNHQNDSLSANYVSYIDTNFKWYTPMMISVWNDEKYNENINFELNKYEQIVELISIQFCLNTHYENLEITDTNDRMIMLNLKDVILQTLYKTNTNSNINYSYVNYAYLRKNMESLTSFIEYSTQLRHFKLCKMKYCRIASFKIKQYKSVIVSYKFYDFNHKKTTQNAMHVNNDLKWHVSTMISVVNIENYDENNVKSIKLTFIECKLINLIKFVESVQKTQTILQSETATSIIRNNYGPLLYRCYENSIDEYIMLQNCMNNLYLAIFNSSIDEILDTKSQTKSIIPFRSTYENVPYFAEIKQFKPVNIASIKYKAEKDQLFCDFTKSNDLISHLRCNLILFEKALNTWKFDFDTHHDVVKQIKAIFNDIYSSLNELYFLTQRPCLNDIITDYNMDLSLLQSRTLDPLLSVLTIRNMLVNINKFMTCFGTEDLVNTTCKESLFFIYCHYKRNHKLTYVTRSVFLSYIDFDGSFQRSFNAAIINQRLKEFEQITNTKIDLISVNLVQKPKNSGCGDKVTSLSNQITFFNDSVFYSHIVHKIAIVKIQFINADITETQLNDVINKLTNGLGLCNSRCRQVNSASLSYLFPNCTFKSCNSDNQIKDLDLCSSRLDSNNAAYEDGSGINWDEFKNI